MCVCLCARCMYIAVSGACVCVPYIYRSEWCVYVCHIYIAVSGVYVPSSTSTSGFSNKTLTIAIVYITTAPPRQSPANLLPSVLYLLSILFLLSILDGNRNADAKREKSPNRPGPRAGASASCRCESSGKSGQTHANIQKQCRWLCV